MNIDPGSQVAGSDGLGDPDSFVQGPGNRTGDEEGNQPRNGDCSRCQGKHDHARHIVSIFHLCCRLVHHAG